MYPRQYDQRSAISSFVYALISGLVSVYALVVTCTLIAISVFNALITAYALAS